VAITTEVGKEAYLNVLSLSVCHQVSKPPLSLISLELTLKSCSLLTFAQSKGLQPGAKATFFLSFVFVGLGGGPKPPPPPPVEPSIKGFLAPEAPPTPGGAVEAEVLGGTPRREEEVEVELEVELEVDGGTPKTDRSEEGVDFEVEVEFVEMVALEEVER